MAKQSARISSSASRTFNSFTSAREDSRDSPGLCRSNDHAQRRRSADSHSSGRGSPAAGAGAAGQAGDRARQSRARAGATGTAATVVAKKKAARRPPSRVFIPVSLRVGGRAGAGAGRAAVARSRSHAARAVAAGRAARLLVVLLVFLAGRSRLIARLPRRATGVPRLSHRAMRTSRLAHAAALLARAAARLAGILCECRQRGRQNECKRKCEYFLHETLRPLVLKYGICEWRFPLEHSSSRIVASPLLCSFHNPASDFRRG